METLSQQALASLPDDSPWRNMLVAKFILTVAGLAARLPDAISRFLAEHASPPGTASEKAAKAAKMPVVELMARIYMLVNGIVDVEEGNPLPLMLRTEGLADFFAGAKVPAEPVPLEFQAKVMLAVFRDAFPSLRQLVMAFSDPQLRKAWNAWSPRDARPGDSLRSARLRGTQTFGYYYYEPYDLSKRIIRVFAVSRVLRRRMSEDVALLDALALATLGSPLVRLACFTKPDLLSWTIADLKDLGKQYDVAFGPLRVALAEHAKLYREHLETGKAASDSPPALVLINCLATRVNDYVTYITGTHPGPDTPHRKAMVAALLSLSNTEVYLRRALHLPYAGSADTIAQFHSDRKQSKEKYSNILDSCDWCDRPFEHFESLKRCSRCRTARYCSQNCQVKGWKKGRKAKDETGKMMVTEQAHKLLCFDAKPAAWKAEPDYVNIRTIESNRDESDAGEFDNLESVRPSDPAAPDSGEQPDEDAFMRAFAGRLRSNDVE